MIIAIQQYIITKNLLLSTHAKSANIKSATHKIKIALHFTVKSLLVFQAYTVSAVVSATVMIAAIITLTGSEKAHRKETI